MSARLCSTSRMRTQTRALTSPAVNTGTAKSSSIVGRVAGRFPRIEIATAGASDIAGRCQTAVRVRGERFRSRRCGPATRRCCRKARSVAETAAGCAARSSRMRVAPSGRRSLATPPGTTRSIISRWPKQASAARNTCSRKMPQCACMSENEASLQMAPMSPK